MHSNPRAAPKNLLSLEARPPCAAAAKSQLNAHCPPARPAPWPPNLCSLDAQYPPALRPLDL
eukprot:12398334-Karenia_brevis.AAC.1